MDNNNNNNNNNNRNDPLLHTYTHTPLFGLCQYI